MAAELYLMIPLIEATVVLFSSLFRRSMHGPVLPCPKEIKCNESTDPGS